MTATLTQALSSFLPFSSFHEYSAGAYWEKLSSENKLPLCHGLSICYPAEQANPQSLRMHSNFSWFLSIYFYGGHIFSPCILKGETLHETHHSLQLPSLGCLWAQPSDGFQTSYGFIHDLAFLPNENGSDISGGISRFKLEVKLPKHIKSEVVWGHSSEHVQEAADYMGLESNERGWNLFQFICCCATNHPKHNILKTCVCFLGHESAI